MYSETLDTGHQAIWSVPQHLRTAHLVVVLHDAGSTAATVAEHYFPVLPEHTTGLALTAGFNATFGHNWFSAVPPQQPTFPEILAAAHRVFDALDDDEYGNHSYTSIQVLGVGQGAALATTMLQLRPETVRSVVTVDGYALQDPMLAAMSGEPTVEKMSGAASIGAPHSVLQMNLQTPGQQPGTISNTWVDAHCVVSTATTTSAITSFLAKNAS